MHPTALAQGEDNEQAVLCFIQVLSFMTQIATVPECSSVFKTNLSGNIKAIPVLNQPKI